MIKQLVISLRKSKVFSRVFHTMEYCVGKELAGCESVLDLGCGPDSLIQFSKQISYSVGVDVYKPYLEITKKRKIHTKYLHSRIQDLKFPKHSFDAVLMLEVLEHLSKSDGLKVLKKIQTWAKKKVIISTPNGYFEMGEVDKNPYQKHVSGWTVKELNTLGYTCHGITGAKFMYSSKNHVHSLHDQFGFSNMRFNPKPVSFIVNALLQLVVYYLPGYAFELFAVKTIK